ncbi:putative DNA-binding domain-containing protein [Pseudomonas aeruginosa]|nr:putative DNA-binding domain-containing protein [Pseudomonas aeruginosa]
MEQVRGCTALSALEGLRIYHNAYRSRLLAVLREDFPGAAAMAGRRVVRATRTGLYRRLATAAFQHSLAG